MKIIVQKEKKSEENAKNIFKLNEEIQARPMKVAIYSQKKDEETIAYLEKFIDELCNREVRAIVHSELATEMKSRNNIETFSCKQDLKEHQVAFFFSFGGDGTIVSSLLYIEDLGIPIVGINTGRLGFLASFTKEEIFDELDFILNKNVKISQRSVIEVIPPKGYDFFPYALNDVTISRKETTSMITVDSYINDEFLNVFWGDGVIIATPTGSTAYSLSCGGSIISPSNRNFAITPIAPHNLNVRPLIVNDEVEIRLNVKSRVPEYTLSLDSRLIHMATETEIIVKKANFDIYLIHPNQLSFYETIRQKLLWGKDKRN